MLLRESGRSKGAVIDLAAINGTAGDGGIEHGAKLIAFTEAVMGGDEDALYRERAELREVLSDEAFVDTAAVIGSFNVVDRIADSTGIPLDDLMERMTRDLREELDLTRFGSSANTPAP